MITATDLEVRAGARTLLAAEGPALRIQPGDRIGLVGRNGAGKTTTMRVLAGEGVIFGLSFDTPSAFSFNAASISSNSPCKSPFCKKDKLDAFPLTS